MAQAKKGNWLPKEVNKLRKIARNARTKEKLLELAKLWGRDYHNLYAKWAYEEGKKENSTEEVDAMVFEIDTTVKTPKRSDSLDVIRMKKGLDLVIPTLQPNGGSIPVPNNLAGAAKRYLDEVYNKNRFTISRERRAGKETGFSRIFKRR